MTLALSNSSLDISNLIISDITPGQLDQTLLIPYFDAMSEIEDPANGFKTREQARKVLEPLDKVISHSCGSYAISDLFLNTGLAIQRTYARQPGTSGPSRCLSHDC